VTAFILRQMRGELIVDRLSSIFPSVVVCFSRSVFSLSFNSLIAVVLRSMTWTKAFASSRFQMMSFQHAYPRQPPMTRQRNVGNPNRTSARYAKPVRLIGSGVRSRSSSSSPSSRAW
jgi:hypothetical protein